MTQTFTAAWRPIKTAPKDGTYVLIACSEVFKARYDDESGLWYFDVDGCAIDPTHWMPLPRVPRSLDNGELKEQPK